MHSNTAKRKNVLKAIVLHEKTHMCYDILQKAIVTEKTTKLEVNNNCISFITPQWADKLMIKFAMEKIFPNAGIISVNTINKKGGNLRFFQGKRYFDTGYKKAMVSVRNMQAVSEVLNVRN
jgi:ribosomal protein L23